MDEVKGSGTDGITGCKLAADVWGKTLIEAEVACGADLAAVITLASKALRVNSLFFDNTWKRNQC